MNSSVSLGTRKWGFAAKGCGKAAIVALGFLVAWPVGSEARTRSPFDDLEAALFGKPRVKRARPKATTAAIPLPPPRPAGAPARIAEPERPQESVALPAPRPPDAPSVPEPEKPQPQAAPPPPSPSACRTALTEDIAVAPSIADITGPGTCGGTDLVRLEAVVLRDATRVPLKPAATLRCEMATAIVVWMRDDIAPLATSLGSTPAMLDNFDSYDCRGRNRVAGAKVSEHGHANALDVRGITLKNGVQLALTDRATARDVREKVLRSVCGRFSTVLGPGSDGYHEDHIHLDLAQRRSAYRICQWAIYDSMPQIAPLMPAPRPDEAPPRAVVETKGDPKAAPAEATAPNAEEEPEADAAPAPPPKPDKKRRAQRK